MAGLVITLAATPTRAADADPIQVDGVELPQTFVLTQETDTVGGGQPAPPVDDPVAPSGPGTPIPSFSPAPTSPGPTSPQPSPAAPSASNPVPPPAEGGEVSGTGAASGAADDGGDVAGDDSASAGEEAAAPEESDSGSPDAAAEGGLWESIRRLQLGVFGGPASGGEQLSGPVDGEGSAAAGPDTSLAQPLGADHAGRPWWHAVLMIGFALVVADAALYLAANHGRVKVTTARDL